MRYLDEVLASGICPKCERRSGTIDEQYSYGVYAGVMCRPCAISSYSDACGHRWEGQGRAEDLDEPLDGDGW
jgi:hypothetical protein